MSTKRSTRTEAKMTATNEERLVEDGTDIVAMALAASARYVDAIRRDLNPRCCEAWFNTTQVCLASLKVNINDEMTDTERCARIVDAMTQVQKDVGEAHIWAERRLGLLTKETENNEAGKA